MVFELMIFHKKLKICKFPVLSCKVWGKPYKTLTN